MRKILILLIAFTICACKSKINTIENSNTDEVEEISVSKALENKIQNFADCVEWVRIIPLETNSNSIISRILKLKFSYQNIYIFDLNSNILIFDNNGKFVKKLLHGNGPGELKSPIDFCVSNSDNCLYINDMFQLNKYSLDGNFITSYYYEPAFGFEQFEIDNGIIVGTTITPNDSMFVVTTDTTFQKVEKTNIGKASFRKSIVATLQKTENGIMISKPMRKNIYCANNGIVGKKYILENNMSEPEDDNLAPKTIEKLKAESMPKFDNQFIGYFHISQNFQIFDFMTIDGKCFQIFRNEKTGNLGSLSGTNCLYAQQVYDYNENVFACVKEPCEDFTNMKLHISPEDMQKLKNLKEDDNPVIVLFKLKSE